MVIINPKYTEAISSVDNLNRYRSNGIFTSWSNRDRKHMQDVLHSKRIRIDKKVEYHGYCNYTRLKIYYDNELVYNFPDEFEGSVDEVCLRGRYTVIDGASQISDASIIQEALEEYMMTPRRLLLDLPKGPYGLYEVLLAADERISYKTVETFQLWFKSRNGLRVAQLRLKNRKK